MSLASRVTSLATRIGTEFKTVRGEFNGATRGNPARKYRVVAGVIRNMGSGWETIEDVGHRSTGIDSVLTNSDHIALNHTAIGVSRVLSLSVTTDEALAGTFDVGASVGLDVTRIYMRKRETLADHISYNGTDWTSTYNLFPGMTFSGGTLTIPHENVFGEFITNGVNGGNNMDVTITPRDGASANYLYSVAAGGVGNTSTQVTIRTLSGALVTTPNTNMRFMFSRGDYMRTINPADVNNTTFPGGNLWIYGVFET